MGKKNRKRRERQRQEKANFVPGESPQKIKTVQTKTEISPVVDNGVTPDLGDNGYIHDEDDIIVTLDKGLVPNMKTFGKIILRKDQRKLIYNEFEEMGERHINSSIHQIANVSSLPGIVGPSIGLPDIHVGYGFSIGNVAAFDLDDPNAIISPGGVGYDINCGVRLLKSNFTEEEVLPNKDSILNALYESIPVGVGSTSPIQLPNKELESSMAQGLNWALENGYAVEEDIENCEENGCLTWADPTAVSDRAKQRGRNQLGTLGSGNHYVELQIVEKVYDEEIAKDFGLFEGQFCIMIHTGSRGLGHQVASDYLASMKSKGYIDSMKLNDNQLACAPISSDIGKSYLGAMAAAANFAFINRQLITHFIRTSMKKIERKMKLDLLYDVCHNIAKIEEHVYEGKKYNLLVHRKGATRSFPPDHPLIPERYRNSGQPVLIGGSMGTSSYVLAGTQRAMEETFGSTCHGAGREHSRSAAKRMITKSEVVKDLEEKNIGIRVGNIKLIAEESPQAYKDVNAVVDTCEEIGISKKVAKMKPIGVIKG